MEKPETIIDNTPMRGGLFLRKVGRIALVMLVVAIAVAGVAFYLLRSEPAHWKQNQAFLQSTSPEELKKIAHGVQRRLLALFEPNRAEAAQNATPNERLVQLAAKVNTTDDDLAELHFTPNEVNAWMHEYLDAWLESNGYNKPAELADPMFAIDGGHLIAAFRYTSPRFTQILSASFEATIYPDGTASVNLIDATAGKLPLPAGAIGSALQRQGGDEQATQAGRWLDKLQDVRFRPVVKLAPGKKVEVLDYHLTNEGLDLTVMAIRASAPASKVVTVPTP